jgi:hypothetical protein
MAELCPFCSKPIMREYGSFRCKSCARSSEDVIDLERKSRAAEVRKAARAAKAAAKTEDAKVATKSKLIELAIARHAERKLKTAAPAGAGKAPAAAASARPARKKGSRSA